MRFAGTSRREPCPACEGSGVNVDPTNPDVLRGACVVCNGTRVRPQLMTVARAWREGKAAGQRAAARRR